MITIVAPWPTSAAGATLVAAANPGSYQHFEELLFGTRNALESAVNGRAHVTANGAFVQANVIIRGRFPDDCYINALVVEQDPRAVPALTAHSGIPGAVIPAGHLIRHKSCKCPEQNRWVGPLT